MGRMRDFFWQRSMDGGGGGGDLADITRDVVSGTDAGDRWQLPKDDDVHFQNLSAGDCTGAFDMRDPLLDELTGAAFSGCSDGDDGGNGRTQKPTSIFPRLVQISPAKHLTVSRGRVRPFPAVTDHSVRIISSQSSGMIKRRKNQAKKVVSIPAPTAANNRTISGEVVPSDLWAWRKYGQKPIKGSPFPRSYYRCSSSKGCLARKQVERSRSDPNMLVITYTSEHSHPWPTQRDALAGSTRSSSNPRKILPPPTKNSNLKEEPVDVETSSSSSRSTVKEESMAIDDKSVFYESNHHSSDFFANLVELESDPNEGVDPFATMFDWEGSTYGDD